jgi:hypothetical protein
MANDVTVANRWDFLVIFHVGKSSGECEALDFPVFPPSMLGFGRVSGIQKTAWVTVLESIHVD